MIGSSLLLLYGVVSAVGSVAILGKGSAKATHWCIYLFLFCHVSLIALVIYDLFTPIHFVWLMIGLVVCLISRWLNGKFVFGKNNWLHYFIVALIFGVAYLMM